MIVLSVLQLPRNGDSISLQKLSILLAYVDLVKSARAYRIGGEIQYTATLWMVKEVQQQRHSDFNLERYLGYPKVHGYDNTQANGMSRLIESTCTYGLHDPYTRNEILFTPPGGLEEFTAI